jgi:hypothetical protein
VPALPPPPENIDELKEANQQTQRDPKYRRISFQSIVAKTTGHGVRRFFVFLIKPIN